MARARSAADKAMQKKATVSRNVGGKTPAKATKAKAAEAKASAERTVYAESDVIEIVKEDGKWWVGSKRRPELGLEEVTVEYAAWLIGNRPVITHYYGKPGGEELDALV